MQLIHRCIDTDCSRARRYRGGLVASKHNSVPCGRRCFILGCNCTPTVKTKKESKTHRSDRIRKTFFHKDTYKRKYTFTCHDRRNQQQKITITMNSISRGRVDHCSRPESSSGNMKMLSEPAILGWNSAITSEADWINTQLFFSNLIPLTISINSRRHWRCSWRCSWCTFQRHCNEKIA